MFGASCVHVSTRKTKTGGRDAKSFHRLSVPAALMPRRGVTLWHNVLARHRSKAGYGKLSAKPKPTCVGPSGVNSNGSNASCAALCGNN